MIDLRLFSNELIGKTFVVVGKERFDVAGCRYSRDTKFKIDNVYPHHVTAHFTCDNGVVIHESFSIGDLVQFGLLPGKNYEQYGEVSK